MAYNSETYTHPQLSNPSGCCPLVTFPVADFFTRLCCLQALPVLFTPSWVGTHQRQHGASFWLAGRQHQWWCTGGLPDPGIAHRHNAQQRVPEVRGPCSNHDTICWGEGYTSATLISLCFAPHILTISLHLFPGPAEGLCIWGGGVI